MSVNVLPRPFCETCVSAARTLGLDMDKLLKELNLRRILRKYYPTIGDTFGLVERLP